MDISKITIGKKPPEDLNVIIEIPMRADPIKYEIDTESGAILVDRIQTAAMYYPANYGFVPHTLCGDGDALDVLVVCDYPLMTGSVINVRPIGVIMMEDESGMDEKIVAVPSIKIDKSQKHINDIKDLPELFVKSIVHFFEHYKDLEDGKWVKIGAVEGAESAKKLIEKAIIASSQK